MYINSVNYKRKRLLLLPGYRETFFVLPVFGDIRYY